MEQSFEAICQELGLKLTDQRRVIAKVLLDSIDHPTAEDVYKRVSEIDNNISLATVYRTVSLLEGYGIIEKLDFSDGKARYEWKSHSKEHHHHLIDLDSGEVIEFQDDELEALKEKIAKRLGYKLVNHRLELYGKKIQKLNK